MKNKKSLLLCFSVSLLLNCGGIDAPPFDSLIDKQPQVVSVTPAEGENFDGRAIEVVFDQPIDPKTVTVKSFVVTSVEKADVDIAALWSKAKKEDVKGMEGTFEISGDQKTIRFVSNEPYPPEIRCGILITPEVMSVDHLPLNQTPGENPTPFFSSFNTLSVVEGISAAQSATVLARPTYLKLNEIFYDAVGSDANGDLFIELKGEPLKNLSDYQLLFVRGSDGEIIDSLKIPDGMKTRSEGFFVIADAVTNQPGVTHVANPDWVTNFDPPNGPDCVQLVDPSGNLVDAVGYGSPLVLQAKNNLLCYLGSPSPDASSGSSLSWDVAAQIWAITPTPSPGSDVQGSSD